MKKSFDQELMDSQKLSQHVMFDVLGFLAKTNRYFGGHKLVLGFLSRLVSRRDGVNPITILDVGCGAGDVCIEIARWARSQRIPVQITGIDIVPEIVQFAKQNTHSFPEIKIALQDVMLVDRSACFDVVIACLFLHHIAPNDQERVLLQLDQLSQKGLLISDLQRSYSSYAAVWVISWLLGNSVVRHDGPLSVRRSFLTEELEVLKSKGKLDYLTVKKEPWFRVSLSGEK